MKCIVIPVEQAQRFAEALASLPIPYSQSRPLMLVLEQARITDVSEPDAAQVDKAKE